MLELLNQYKIFKQVQKYYTVAEREIIRKDILNQIDKITSGNKSGKK